MKILFFFCCFFGLAAEPHRVLGIGSATIDLLIQVDDPFISKFVPGGKGASCDVDAATVDRILSYSQHSPKIVPGGSAANTIRALSRLGERCSFYSSIGADPFGDHFSENLRRHGIETKLCVLPEIATSKVLCVIAPDGERSFLGYNPKAPDFSLTEEQVAGNEWVHFEARTLDVEFCLERSMQLAKEAGAKISIDLSSREIVKKYKPVLLHLLSNYVDVVFCNEMEIQAITGLSPEEGCLALQSICPIAVVTLGPKGCLVGNQGQLLKAAAFPAEVVDTTGAGDYFSAGFLHGYLGGYPLELCAEMGNRLGSAIIQVVGAELPEEKWADLRLSLETVTLL